MFVALLLLSHALAGQTGDPQTTNTVPQRVLAPVTAVDGGGTVKLTIKAMVVDRDLNVKPIPKFAFSLRPIADQVGKPDQETITTKLDGTIEIQVVPGRYRITSARSLDFEGKGYSWDVQVTVASTGTVLELSNDNATIVDGVPSVIDDLASVFKKYRDTVVTVWAEVGAGHGTGFIVDPSGLVITNQHVVTTSEYIAVQFDQTRTLPAVVLASDPTKDVAVLWVNFAQVSEAQAAPLLKEGSLPAEEGERVFTIGSPLHQSKVMTTGIVSKVEARAIISDLNINHGNSGGPLFNSRGRVIGITTFGDTSGAGGPGISGVVRIEEALPLIEQARARMASTARPSAEFLPSLPIDTYPIDALKANANLEKFNEDPYSFEIADYDVAFVTPILKYRHLAKDVQAFKEKEKRNAKGAGSVHGTFEPLDELKGWEEYVGEYEPVLIVQASPKLKESFWSTFRRGVVTGGAFTGSAKMRFKTDFYKMKLLCGSKEIRPLFPGKIQRVVDIHDENVNVTDATYDGLYKYPADAITSNCGTVTLQLFSEKDPNLPRARVLDKKTINAVVADFVPYLAQHKSERQP
jgi:S1-C subfamily serine protease